ncbi:MAG: DUF309 domain-containing protein [Terriglobales bacterium]|jgi:predicted metal-dependent hydrolase
MGSKNPRSHPGGNSHIAAGLKLFNLAHFFDAHEELEEAWREAPRGTPQRRHLQGLVQLAVAFHHESRRNIAGARSVLDRGIRNLAGADESLPDLDFDRLRSDLAQWQKHLAGTDHERNRPKPPRIAQRDR